MLLSLALEVPRREFQLTGAQLLMLGISVLVTVLCVLLHYEVMNMTSWVLSHVTRLRRMRIVLLILALLGAHVAEVWIFGLTFWLLDQWPSLGQLDGVFNEGAFDFVYYSVTTFTTIGFGDVVPTGAIRILTGTEALVGLSLITWSASLAFLEMQRDWAEFARSRERSRES